MTEEEQKEKEQEKAKRECLKKTKTLHEYVKEDETTDYGDYWDDDDEPNDKFCLYHYWVYAAKSGVKVPGIGDYTSCASWERRWGNCYADWETDDLAEAIDHCQERRDYLHDDGWCNIYVIRENCYGDRKIVDYVMY